MDAQGIIRGHKTEAKLNREELIFLAEDRMEGGLGLKLKVGVTREYALAVEWMEVAYE